MGNKFFLTREAASHSGPERFHFATNLNRTLTIEEGKELRDLLTEMLGEIPKAEPPAEPTVPDPKAEEDFNAKVSELSQREGISWKKAAEKLRSGV
jgi:hypothetical protein